MYVYTRSVYIRSEIKDTLPWFTNLSINRCFAELVLPHEEFNFGFDIILYIYIYIYTTSRFGLQNFKDRLIQAVKRRKFSVYKLGRYPGSN
jgi:hypothetical protein